MPVPVAGTNGLRVPKDQYRCTPSARCTVQLFFERQYVLTSPVPSLYHWRFLIAARFCVRQEALRESMNSAFKIWVGQPVVLQVALGSIKVPVRGKLLKDDGDTVRIRVGEGWDVDIYKEMILAVEEDAMVLLPA